MIGHVLFLKLTVTKKETVVYFCIKVTTQPSLKAQQHCIILPFHSTVRPSVLILSGEQ